MPKIPANSHKSSQRKIQLIRPSKTVLKNGYAHEHIRTIDSCIETMYGLYNYEYIDRCQKQAILEIKKAF